MTLRRCLSTGLPLSVQSVAREAPIPAFISLTAPYIFVMFLVKKWANPFACNPSYTCPFLMKTAPIFPQPIKTDIRDIADVCFYCDHLFTL
jgi:hypothetical protein